MSKDTATARRGIGVEERAWIPELRRALLWWGGDATINKMSSRGEANLRLLDVG
ncbi:hypothetical protein ACFXOY_13850 [Streptomyces niveus]|uniref:hypothetical protein n=1 Tax=Streptomyces niveus TaxID=193462 RepID=UPI0036B9B52C